MNETEFLKEQGIKFLENEIWSYEGYVRDVRKILNDKRRTKGKKEKKQ